MEALTELAFFTVYKNPSDYPGKYVVRRTRVAAGNELIDANASVFDTLEEARAVIPAGLYRIARHPTDPPAVVEVWF